MREDEDNQAKTGLMEKMVKDYMEIVHTTVLDMVPKYIIMSLVQEVSKNIRGLNMHVFKVKESTLKSILVSRC